MKHLIPLILIVAGWCQAGMMIKTVWNTEPTNGGTYYFKILERQLSGVHGQVTEFVIIPPQGWVIVAEPNQVRIIELIFTVYVNGTSRIYHDDPACQYVAESSRIITLTQEKADEFQAQLRLCLSCLAKKLQE